MKQLKMVKISVDANKIIRNSSMNIIGEKSLEAQIVLVRYDYSNEEWETLPLTDSIEIQRTDLVTKEEIKIFYEDITSHDGNYIVYLALLQDMGNKIAVTPLAGNVENLEINKTYYFKKEQGK